MKNISKSAVIFSLIALLLLGLLVSCDDDSGVLADISSISIKDSRETLILTVNQTLKVDATIAPLDNPIKEAIWESSNKSVATVDSSGNVKGIKGGYATITVKSEDGKIKATKHVVVGDIVLKDSADIEKVIEDLNENSVIVLSSGEYEKDLKIEQQVSLLGPNAGIVGYADRNGEAVLKGSIKIEADNVTIDGLEVKHGSSSLSRERGVYITSSVKNTTIANNIINGEGNSVDSIFTSGVSTSIVGNYIFGGNGSGNGLWTEPSGNLNIIANKIEGYRSSVNFNSGDVVEFDINISENEFKPTGAHGISIGGKVAFNNYNFKIEGNTFIVEGDAQSSISDRLTETTTNRDNDWRLTILENNNIPINHEWFNDGKNPPRWYLGVKAD